MKISKIIKTNFLLFCGFFFLFLTLQISNQIKRPIVFISKQDSSLNLNNQMIRFFHLGQRRFISSILWIATILESDIEHYKNKDLNSWMYLRFKTISEIEPKFYENYVFGGVYLSIVKDDLSGASYIYEKGLKQYPNDFELLKNAAFHFYFEVGNVEKSYPLYSTLKKHPKATSSMINTLARIESQSGRLESAYELLKEKYDNELDKKSSIANSTAYFLYAIKAEIDLDCLNKNQRPNCSHKDFNNDEYVLNEKNIYIAKRKWIPFRPKFPNKPSR